MIARTLVVLAVLLLDGCRFSYRGVDWHFWITTEFEFDEMRAPR